MKIGYLGAGAWGYCLASLLAENGHEVICWAKDAELVRALKENAEHPKFPGFKVSSKIHFTNEFKEAVDGVDIIVESVTSTGLRPTLENILKLGPLRCPIVITSKGIEPKTGMLLPEVVLELCGEEAIDKIACLSGPSLAEEVMQKLPTSVVAASTNNALRNLVVELFTTPYFRVYPNKDIMGVAFGGAMKNIIAIACGIADGLEFGQNSKAALMTRGLHEIRKLAFVKKAHADTLSGLAGLGDLCTTCLSELSRNYRFGKLIGEGVPVDQARKKVKMVVEGANTCIAALELGKKEKVPLPITQAIYSIIYEELDPMVAVQSLLKREIKEEML